MSTANRLFVKAFNAASHREPRSAEYRAGVMAALRYRFDGESIPQPYKPGTVQLDAFCAGLDEGHLIFRRHESGTF